MSVLSAQDREYIYQISRHLQQKPPHRPLLIEDPDLGWKIFFWCHCVFYKQVEGYEHTKLEDARALLENITLDFTLSPFFTVNWFNALCFCGSRLAIDFYAQNKDVLDMPHVDPGFVFSCPSRLIRGIVISLLHSETDKTLNAFLSRFPSLLREKNLISITESLPLSILNFAKRCFANHGILSLPEISNPKIAVKHIANKEWFPTLTENDVLDMLLNQDELYYDDSNSLHQLRSKYQTPSF